MHLLVSSQVLKQRRPILRAGAIIFRRKHCLRGFDIRQGAASFRPPQAQETPSYRLISGRRKGVENRCPFWVVRDQAIQPRCRPMSAMHPEATKILQRRDWSPCAIRDTSKIYSITSSAIARTVGGRLSPSILAVLELTTRTNLVGCSTGRSAGFAPLRILST